MLLVLVMLMLVIAIARVVVVVVVVEVEVEVAVAMLELGVVSGRAPKAALLCRVALRARNTGCGSRRRTASRRDPVAQSHCKVVDPPRSRLRR